MRNPSKLFVIGSLLVLLGLAACLQTRQKENAATPISVAQVIPTEPTNAKIAEEVAGVAMLKIPPSATPTVKPPLAPSATPTVVNLIPLPPAVSGIVQNPDGPLANAIIQIKGSAKQVQSAKDGAYQIDGLSGTTPAIITAWAEGHMVGWAVVNPSAPDWKGSDQVNITLRPLPQTDNLNYPWFSFNGVTGSASCGLCHREYDEWKADAHSNAAQNIRFLSIYNGTNLNGEESQPIQWGDQGKALPPDPEKPYYGPGFRLDTPDRAGNCATCHTPVASKVSNQNNCGWSGCHTDLTIERSNGIIAPSTRPIGLSGDGAEGVTCDFCHKVGEVIVDPHTRLPKPDMPGILSMQLFRPQDGDQVFFGTLVDINRRVSYAPVESQSEFCGPCHYGVFGGVVGVGKVTGGTIIYNSYGEWLESPYSDPESGKTCQQCHMQVVDEKYFVFPEMGGLEREYAELHDHYMPGAADAKFLQNTVTLESSAERAGDQLFVSVSLTNDQAGHHVPTDSPSRQMILVVEAVDASGNMLALKEGPLNPEWAGNYAAQPGRTYMKVLRDEWTGETPTSAYWRPVTIVEDTRLAALATDKQQYTFQLAPGTEATVRIRVLFRRTFQQLAQQKGFTDEDILMEETTIPITK